jgi:hypothetical protein
MSCNSPTFQDVFGTQATQKTLTASYVADTTSIFYTGRAKQVLVEEEFTPGTNAEKSRLQIFTSSDRGLGSPSVFHLFSEYRSPDDTTTPTLMNVVAVPYSLPYETVTVAATVYRRSFVIEPRGAEWIQVKAASSLPSGTFGTSHVRVTATY